MDQSKHKHGSHLQRQLSSLKLISRLLAHELHAQGGARQVTLTRDEVVELQTTIDLFIEEASRTLGSSGGAGSPAGDTHLVPARN